MSENNSLFIIEDNKVSQLMLKNYVSNNFNYKIIDFFTVEDCLGLSGEYPRIILLDYELPGMNGLEAIPKLKEKWPQSQIIIISGLNDKEIKKTLFKSFDTIDFIEKIGNLEKNLIDSIVQAEKILKIINI